jgi:hypothetical protein
VGCLIHSKGSLTGAGLPAEQIDVELAFRFGVVESDHMLEQLVVGNVMAISVQFLSSQNVTDPIAPGVPVHRHEQEAFA